MEQLVREFMTSFDQETFPSVERTPCEVALFRSALITEEAKEYSRAPLHSEEELDAICDLLYVVIGTNITMSVPVLPMPRFTAGPFDVKQVIWEPVLSITQDLDCRFPCEKVQRKALNFLIHLLIDIANMTGYKLLPAFEEVHKSNMTKLWTTLPEDKSLTVTPKGDRFLVKRKDGKVVKPPTFIPPNLTPFL